MWFQFVHLAHVWNSGWIHLLKSYSSSDLSTHEKHHSIIVSLVADHHMHPYGRSSCLLCQQKQGVVLPLLLLTHSLRSIQLLQETLLTSHLQCSRLCMYDDRVVWFYKALVKRNICSAIVILISRRGVVSRPSSSGSILLLHKNTVSLKRTLQTWWKREWEDDKGRNFRCKTTSNPYM